MSNSEASALLCKNIAFLRKSKQMTQDQFSAQLGINRPMLGSYEEQRAVPPIYVIIVISNLTGISIDDLLKTDLEKEITE